MSEHVRGFRVLMAFGLRAAPWPTVIFLLSAVIMALEGLVVPVGLKLLADAAVALDLRAGLVAALIIAATTGIAVVNLQFHVTLIFTVIERAGALIDRAADGADRGDCGFGASRTPRLPGRDGDLARAASRSLAWMTNAAGRAAPHRGAADRECHSAWPDCTRCCCCCPCSGSALRWPNDA